MRMTEAHGGIPPMISHSPDKRFQYVPISDVKMGSTDEMIYNSVEYNSQAHMFTKQGSDIYSQNFYSPSASPQKNQMNPRFVNQPQRQMKPALANIAEQQQDMEATF